MRPLLLLLATSAGAIPHGTRRPFDALHNLRPAGLERRRTSFGGSCDAEAKKSDYKQGWQCLRGGTGGCHPAKCTKTFIQSPVWGWRYRWKKVESEAKPELGTPAYNSARTDPEVERSPREDAYRAMMDSMDRREKAARQEMYRRMKEAWQEIQEEMPSLRLDNPLAREQWRNAWLEAHESTPYPSQSNFGPASL